MQEAGEQKGADALVAVGEWVVLTTKYSRCAARDSSVGRPARRTRLVEVAEQAARPSSRSLPKSALAWPLGDQVRLQGGDAGALSATAAARRQGGCAGR